MVNQSGEDPRWAESESSSLLAGVNVETGEKIPLAEAEREEDSEEQKFPKQIVSSEQAFQPQPSATGLRPSPSSAVQPQKSSPKPTPEPAVSETEESAKPSLPPTPLPSPSPSVSFPININTASSVELQEITGIGPVLAQRIIDYRNSNGLFQRIEDIKLVSGIGDITFEKMKNQITVGDVVVLSPSPTQPPSSETPASQGKININMAEYEELQEITGVGPVLAQRIIDYREEHGPFQGIEDIKLVSGIGEVTFEKMKAEIEV